MKYGILLFTVVAVTSMTLIGVPEFLTAIVAGLLSIAVIGEALS